MGSWWFLVAAKLKHTGEIDLATNKKKTTCLIKAGSNVEGNFCFTYFLWSLRIVIQIINLSAGCQLNFCH